MTAAPGNNVATANAADRCRLPIPNAAEAMNVNRTHHQNSDRVVRPLKSVYLVKQFLMASMNLLCYFLMRLLHIGQEIGDGVSPNCRIGGAERLMSIAIKRRQLHELNDGLRTSLVGVEQ